MNIKTYSHYYTKDDKYNIIVKDEFRNELKELIYKDVLEIFDNYINIGNTDYRIDWKLIDYYYLLRDMMKDYYKV